MTLSIRRKVAPFAVGIVVMLGALSVTAQDEVLQLSVVGGVSGSIESSVAGFSCATMCSTTLAAGGTVTLTASPAAGSVFESWSGDCSGLQATCTLLMDGTKLAVASFKPAGDPFTVIHRFLPGGDGLTRPGGLLVNGGFLYGMTHNGGRAGLGMIFRELANGSEHTILHDFLGGVVDGEQPMGGVLITSGGVLYGMTPFGGAGGLGTVFKINVDGSGFGLLHSFTDTKSDGMLPYGSLLELGGVLYGMTYTGGAFGWGTIFKINPDGTGFTLLHSFARSDGQGPNASLIALGGVLYGVTLGGGAGDNGVIFRINPDGSGFTVLHSFSTYLNDGDTPQGSLIAVGGALYGVTSFGGSKNAGTVFKINPDGSGFAHLHDFAGYPTDGKLPQASLVTAGGALYGTTLFGGPGGCKDGGGITNGCGSIFKINTDGSGFTLLYSSDGNFLNSPNPSCILAESEGVLFGSMYRMNLDGSGFAQLHSFTRAGITEGNTPYGSVVESGGALYGMTSQGGAGSCRNKYNFVVGCGTIFRINPDGSGYALEHTFLGGALDGGMPHGSLIASNGALFGMTMQGGASNLGTVFALRNGGNGYSLLHSFAGGDSDGQNPAGSLLAFGGALYAMTSQGGEGSCTDPIGTPIGCGTVFRVNPDGTGFKLLHSFDEFLNSDAVTTGALIVSGEVLFGMTQRGGTGYNGSIFKIRPDGDDYALLHSFSSGIDGQYPDGSLIAYGPTLFGMTPGGFQNAGAIFKVNDDGTGFSVLHSFFDEVGSAGISPSGSLIVEGGAFYGMTVLGGDERCQTLFNANSHGCGTIFKINADGSGYTVLHAFSGGDGLHPRFATLTSFDGRLYGVTSSGGIGNNGVLFRFDLPPRRPRRHLSRQ